MTSAFDLDQFRSLYPEGIEHDYWTVARNWVIAGALEPIPSNARVLEIGCGRGAVLKHLLASGRDAWGSELGSPPTLAGTEQRIFTDAAAEKLPTEFRASIRCLLLLDVIEHIDDAPAFLRDIAAAYPNADTIILTVPAGPEVWTAYDERLGHFRRYTADALERDIVAAGLTPVRISYFFRSLYLAARCLKALGIGRAGLRGSRPKRRNLHRLAALLLWIETRMLAWSSLRGLSLLAIARR